MVCDGCLGEEGVDQTGPDEMEDVPKSKMRAYRMISTGYSAIVDPFEFCFLLHHLRHVK